ncbi:MAG: redox-sensing transcriptional repressor Rex [Christensenellaceae bacterium]
MNELEISKATIGRMPLYLRFLQEENSRGEKYISSAVIAQNIPVSAVLVRKDLALVSSKPGKPRLGFEVVRLIADIEKFLGYDNLSDAVIVGAGGLGKAFLGYEGFKSNGLNIVAAFDVDPRIVGEEIAGKKVYPMDKFSDFVQHKKINIGIITVPKAAAQEILDAMVRAGIKAVWNFAPAPLRVPKGIILKNEDLSASLALLAGELSKGR